jgi:hypothetical protein
VLLLGEIRYNELLNLPYVHERVEGLWRIIEALGDSVPFLKRKPRKRPAPGNLPSSYDRYAVKGKVLHCRPLYLSATDPFSFNVAKLIV